MRKDYVLVKRLQSPSATKGGIVLPGSARELPQIATVVAIGPKNPEQVRVGDMVLLMKFAGVRWVPDSNNEEDDYYLLRVKELLAVIR